MLIFQIAFRNLKSPALRFLVDGNILKTKLLSHDNHNIPLPEFYSTTNAKWPVLVAFSNLSGVRVDGKHLMRSQSETRVFEFHWRVDEPQSGIKNQNESYQIWPIRLHNTERIRACNKKHANRHDWIWVYSWLVEKQDVCCHWLQRELPAAWSNFSKLSKMRH